MKKFLIILFAILIMLLNIQICIAGTNVDVPDEPDIEWDDDYSKSTSMQKVTMTAEVPDGAEKIKFYLFADDEVEVKTRTVSSSTEEVSQNFYSLHESQEVWGYVIAVDDDNDETEPSKWAHEYIGQISNNKEDVETPDEPLIEWEDAGDSTSNSQKVTISAELPSGADYLKYFLICDGKIRDSSKTDNDDYTFRSVDYDQTVIAYVKAYDGNDESYMSDVVTLYIGDSGEINAPSTPGIQWVDNGFDSTNGQEIKMSAVFPSDATKLRYYLIANGTVMISPLISSSTYTFSNIYDNQTVIGFIRAYDKFDNESEDSQRAQIYIPSRTSSSGDTNSGYLPEYNLQSKERIINEDIGLSIRDFNYPEIIINSTFYFSDVDKHDYELKEALQYFYSAGIFDASYGDKFNPNNYISRTEFLKLMLKATDTAYENMSTIYVPFKDITYGDENHNIVAYTVANSLMRGNTNYKFYPSEPVTCGQAVSACVKHFAIRRYVYMGEGLIDDYEEHCLDALKSSNILNTNKIFKINTKMTRAEAVRLVYRILKLKMDA